MLDERLLCVKETAEGVDAAMVADGLISDLGVMLLYNKDEEALAAKGTLMFSHKWKEGGAGDRDTVPSFVRRMICGRRFALNSG